MKFTSIVLLAVLVAYATSPSCVKTNLCMGCHKTTANQCTACFNWVKGKIGPRSLDAAATPNDCKSVFAPAVPLGVAYQGAKAKGTAQQAATSVLSDVYWCSVAYLNFDNFAAAKSIACSKTPSDKSCKKMANCMNSTICYKTADANDAQKSVFTVGCQTCKKGYTGGSVATTAGNTNASCGKSKTVANCNWEWRTGAAKIECFECKSKFAVKNDGSCGAFTTDKNCRAFNSDDDGCEQCFFAYYWDTAKCKLAAKVIFVGAIMALINFLF